MNLFRTSVIGGFCLASLHFCWALLVALGLAQPLMDFIFKLHMLNSPFQVQIFNWGLALSLIAVTFVIGAFYSFIFYFIKNSFSQTSSQINTASR